MSYILDALNKSEQDRKEQQYTPSLQASHTAPLPEVAYGKIALWVFIGIIVVALLSTALFFFSANRSENEQSQPVIVPASPVERAVTDLTSKSVSVAETEVNTAPQQYVSQASGAVLKPPNFALKPVSGQSSADSINELYQQDAGGIKEAASAQNQAGVNAQQSSSVLPNAAQANQNEAPIAHQPSQQQLAEKAAAYMEELRAVERELEQEQALHAAVQDSVALNDMEQARVAPVEPKKWVPHISEMPESLQAAIPSIEFSAHVYAFDASAGFVILNGSTRYPGDRITADIIVEEIIEEGVVLSHKGQLFRLDSMRDWINN